MGSLKTDGVDKVFGDAEGKRKGKRKKEGRQRR